MLDTFKALLKAESKASGANLSQKRIDAIADRLHKRFPDLTEEADHKEKLDALYSPEDFKELAALDDYQRAKEAKEKKDKEKTGEASKEKSASSQADDEPEWKKELAEMKQALASFQKERSQQTIQEKVKSHDKLKSIPASFLKGRSLPDSPDAIDAFVEEVTSDYAAFKQELANEGFAQSSRPGGGTGNQKAATAGVSPEVKAFAEKNLKPQETKK